MYRLIREDIAMAIDGWRRDWPHMYANVATSFFGQIIFWKFGYDQLSIGGTAGRVMESGQGQRVAGFVYDRVPHTPTAINTAKAIEIALDLGKCFTEGATMRRTGLAPDAVACLVTQPTWSLIEAVEKLGSYLATRQNYQAVDEQEFRTSIACSYGSLFRYGLDAGVLVFADQIEQYIRAPIEREVRRHPRTAVIVGVGYMTYRTRAVIRAYQAPKAPRSP